MDEGQTIGLIPDDKAVPHIAATELILGMLITKLDKVHPGLQEELRDDFRHITDRMRAEAVGPIRDLDEMQAVAAKVLRPYSG